MDNPYSLRLYHYWRSSSSWRVRWALQLKGIKCDYVPVNLLSDETENPEYLRKNPLGYVPVLEVIDAESPIRYLSESIAIIEWLEETYPTHSPSLFSGDSFQKARIRQLAEIINSGTQPLQNLNVSLFHSSHSEEQKKWNTHWIRRGMQAFEKLVQETSRLYSVGDTLTLADLFLIPQCYNALRNEISLSDYPVIEKIYQAALKTESCQDSAPDQFQI